MTTSPRTLRLHNLSQNDLSIQLRRNTNRFNPRLRRGMHVTNIKVARGSVFDVCKTLDVTYAEARSIIDGSPMVKARVRSTDLLVRDHPPSEENLAAEAKVEAQQQEAQAKTNAMNPPDAPGALPAGVPPSAVGLPDDTPRMRHPPTSASKLFDVTPVAPEAAAVELAAEVEESAEVAPEPEEPADKTPSMEWSLRRLKNLAIEKGIDVDKARSKTAILKRIKEAQDGSD